MNIWKSVIYCWCLTGFGPYSSLTKVSKQVIHHTPMIHQCQGTPCDGANPIHQRCREWLARGAQLLQRLRVAAEEVWLSGAAECHAWRVGALARWRGWCSKGNVDYSWLPSFYCSVLLTYAKTKHCVNQFRWVLFWMSEASKALGTASMQRWSALTVPLAVGMPHVAMDQLAKHDVLTNHDE